MGQGKGREDAASHNFKKERIDLEKGRVVVRFACIAFINVMPPQTYVCASKRACMSENFHCQSERDQISICEREQEGGKTLITNSSPFLGYSCVILATGSSKPGKKN